MEFGINKTGIINIFHECTQSRQLIGRRDGEEACRYSTLTSDTELMQ